MDSREHRLNQLLMKPLIGFELEKSDVIDNLVNLRDAIRIALADEQTPPSNAAVFKMIYRMTAEPDR